MAKRMQHCFWCGEELGVYDSYPGDIQCCGAPGCNAEYRHEMQAREADARDAAAEDNYDRYR